MEWRISELLEQPGDACPVAAGSRFFVVSLHEETLCTLLAAAPAASTLALPPLDAQQQQQPERLATPQEQHLAKRQRLEQPVNGAGTAPSIPAAPAGAAGRSDPGPPVHLLETEGIPQGFNVPPMGATLGDLAGGAPSLALVTSYKVDFPWLLSVCPGLRTAGQVCGVGWWLTGRGWVSSPTVPPACRLVGLPVAAAIVSRTASVLPCKAPACRWAGANSRAVQAVGVRLAPLSRHACRHALHAMHR